MQASIENQWGKVQLSSLWHCVNDTFRWMGQLNAESVILPHLIREGLLFVQRFCSNVKSLKAQGYSCLGLFEGLILL